MLTDDGHPLVTLYGASNGKIYLQINNFRQRIRSDQSKCPPPDGHMTVTCPADDGPLRASRARAQSESYSRSETQTQTDAATVRAPDSPTPPPSDALDESGNGKVSTENTLGDTRKITRSISGNGPIPAQDLLKPAAMMNPPKIPDYAKLTRWFQEEYPKNVFENDVQLLISMIETEADEKKLRINLAKWKACDEWRRGFIPSAENFISKRIWGQSPRDPPKESEPYKPNYYKPPTLEDPL